MWVLRLDFAFNFTPNLALILNQFVSATTKQLACVSSAECECQIKDSYCVDQMAVFSWYSLTEFHAKRRNFLHNVSVDVHDRNNAHCKQCTSISALRISEIILTDESRGKVCH